ncbi:hypothetical protein [Marilutibacter chinensis]|uniref:Uncharacterized protein n=1 Tax=Marilutibacter chinensis TaxID=2912247 RepID=A0ABS9HWX6_9GAMM|nr:hypothetical protein [Lysobacter chinensis]MCF7223273.1 hypothetical protein [Lysobacter chinensis]
MGAADACTSAMQARDRGQRRSTDASRRVHGLTASMLNRDTADAWGKRLDAGN